ncbi:hypothetical protein BGW36DRAFT_369600 [Talaromyces proteolyticus]|uniref:Fungal specific transcription factor n=1 Tax=Talaromyces proteolyticus TaxID=1131652 RepID=A0AAD4L2W6_9EURO|nr:uncharacterized protein BGW36DRAFT_369600 [Talaromyces proteolyticus]KAH8703599.1 hypothetical protein BGW36DRAFT_369600 [Talaromyces proteolyticus]
MPKTLSESRWAVPSSTTADPAGEPSPPQELARFMKIVSRLKWKLPFLSEAYSFATSRDGVPPDDVAYAEIMFKIDFHEYYALLERAIVHLLAVFGVSVNNRFQKSHVPRNGSHRYHANVLEALEKESCPLHPILGSGEVLGQLRRAKQLRNQWKTADSTEDERQQELLASSEKDKDTLPLESYDLENILTAIFVGLEEAYALAQGHVSATPMAIETSSDAADPRPWNTETGWDFIVDAMDWQAV